MVSDVLNPAVGGGKWHFEGLRVIFQCFVYLTIRYNSKHHLMVKLCALYYGHSKNIQHFTFYRETNGQRFNQFQEFQSHTLSPIQL